MIDKHPTIEAIAGLTPHMELQNLNTMRKSVAFKLEITYFEPRPCPTERQQANVHRAKRQIADWLYRDVTDELHRIRQLAMMGDRPSLNEAGDRIAKLIDSLTY